MIRLRRRVALLACLPVLLVSARLSAGQVASPRPAELGSKTWVGRYQEVEEYLRTAECIRMEQLTGVSTRCVLRPGGPVSRMHWFPLLRGVYRGFREDYKSNIAAYELDKLLRMDMVPPAVERELQGNRGAATQWVENLIDWSKTETSASASERAHWQQQLVRMRMFDNLIGNGDRNQGTMLADAAWNLMLIDHTRAFGPDADLPNKLTQIDRDYWARLENLTRTQLDATLRRWIDDDQIGAILKRREKMAAEVKSLVR